MRKKLWGILLAGALVLQGSLVVQAKEIPVEAGSEVQTSSEVPEASAVNAQWKTAYAGILSNWKNVERYVDTSYLKTYFTSYDGKEYYKFDQYFVYDLDKNGIPELFLHSTSMNLTVVCTYDTTIRGLGYQQIDRINEATQEIVVHGHWNGRGGSGTNEWHSYKMVNNELARQSYIDILGSKVTVLIGNNSSSSQSDYENAYNLHVRNAKMYSTFKKYSLSDQSGLNSLDSTTAETKSIILSKTSAVLNKNATLSLTAKVTGMNGSIVWSSSDSSIASVDSNGKITARSQGTATIYASLLNIRVSCTITVRDSSNWYQSVLNATSGSYRVKTLCFDETVRTRTKYRISYSYYKLADINGDGVMELFLSNNSTGTTSKGSVLILTYYDNQVTPLFCFDGMRAKIRIKDSVLGVYHGYNTGGNLRLYKLEAGSLNYKMGLTHTLNYSTRRQIYKKDGQICSFNTYNTRINRYWTGGSQLSFSKILK